MLGTCYICKKVFLFLYSESPKGSSSDVADAGTKVILEYVYPITIPEISNNVPSEIAKTYEEGIICLNSNAPNGAVAVFRRTLQKICIDKNATQGDKLADQLSVIPTDLQKEAFELKQWGNIAAHPDKIISDVLIEDAKEMKGFLERVIYLVY